MQLSGGYNSTVKRSKEEIENKSARNKEGAKYSCLEGVWYNTRKQTHTHTLKLFGLLPPKHPAVMLNKLV